MIVALIFGIAFWSLLLYFFAAPWVALFALVSLVVVGLWFHHELREVEIEEPGPADLIDFEAELRCRGRLPRDEHYEGLTGKTRVGIDRRAS